MSTLLEISKLRVNYGVIEAVKGIDFRLTQGQITTLLGANGAGKSTTLLAISGLLRVAAGSIIFDGDNLSNWAPHRIFARGVVQVAEGREILTTLTVKENLLLGAYRRGHDHQVAGDLANLEHIIRNDAVLPAAGLDDCEHRCFPSCSIPASRYGTPGRLLVQSLWFSVFQAGLDARSILRAPQESPPNPRKRQAAREHPRRSKAVL